MSDLEEDHFFNCPYCMEQICVSVDRAGGRKQSFTQDCEVCCQPIAFELEIDNEGVLIFRVRTES